MSTTTRGAIETFFGFFGGDVLTVDETNGIDRLLDEVFLRLAQDPRAWISTYAVTDSGTSADPTDLIRYELRASLGVQRLLAVFVDDRQLSHEREKALPPAWRDQRGAPIAYITDAKSDRFLEFFPHPDRVATGRTFTDLEGAPSILYAEGATRTAIPAHLALPMTLLLIEREFSRESAHRDEDFATICMTLAESFLKMLQ